MQLPRMSFTWWKSSITLLIAADLFALWVWAARPPMIYSHWLGLVGLSEDSPIPRLVAWAAWENGPRTPSGCWCLFEPAELFFAGVLLFVLLLLIVLLFARARTRSPLWLRLSAPFTWPKRWRSVSGSHCARGHRDPGSVLGWEINAWRTWRLRSCLPGGMPLKRPRV